MTFVKPRSILIALAFAAVALTACSDACRNLASQICYCLPDDGTRATCNQEATSNADIFSVNGTDAAYCQHLLDTNACDCNRLTTSEGKAGCGLTYSTDAGVADGGQQ